MCARVSPTAARCMKSAISCHGRDHREGHRDVPRRGARVLLDQLLDLGQPVGVVDDDVVEPALKVGEAVLVGGEHLVHVQVVAP